MEKIIGVMQTILPVFTMVIAGSVLRRKQIITQEGITEMKSLLVNFCLPFMLFGTFYSIKFTWKEAVLILELAVLTLTVFLIGFLICKLFHVEHSIGPYLCTTIEGGSIGYALFILLFGQDNLYHIALMDLGNAIIQWTLITTCLNLRTKGSVSAKKIIKSAITPINIGIFGGLFFGVMGIGHIISLTACGSVLNSVFAMAGRPVATIILISVGFDLTFKHVAWKETLRAVFSRALLYACIGVILFISMGYLFPDDLLYRWSALVFAILPPTYAYSVFTKDEEEASFLGTYLALYTVITIIGFTVIAVIVS